VGSIHCCCLGKEDREVDSIPITSTSVALQNCYHANEPNSVKLLMVSHNFMSPWQVNPMIEAAIAAGADTAYLSGSGPTVAAITSGAAGDIFLQRTKERVDKQVGKTRLAFEYA